VTSRGLFLWAAALCACAPRIIWTGMDPARAVRAEVLTDGRQQWVRLGEREEHARFDSIGDLGVILSPDGRRSAYAARREERWWMVVDGAPLGPWDGIAEVKFSPDGRRLAFVAQAGERWSVVVDGVPDRPFGFIQPGTLGFSADGGTVAYAAREGQCARVVIDGKRGHCWDRVRALHALPGGAVAAVVERGGRQHFLAGDDLGPGFEAVGAWHVSPDGARFCYAAHDGGRWIVVTRRGLHGPVAPAIPAVRCTEDGRRLAWIASDGQHAWAVIDGVEGPRFRMVSQLLLAEDGAGFAYLAEDERGAWLVSDGRQSGPHAAVLDVALSPTGHVAFTVRDAGRVRVIHPAGETEADLVLPGTLVVSGDGAHWGAIHGDLARRELWLTVDGVRRRAVKAEDVLSRTGRDLRSWVALELARSEGGEP
jgi:hypothetical protein